jgi:GxxExxY protein
VPKLTGLVHHSLCRDELTGKIIGACFRVANGLGHGFPEGVYLNALMLELADEGLEASRQVPLAVTYRGVTVGEYFADIVVASRVILELKSVTCLLTEHQAQLINYLTATGHDTGLLINFGRPRLEYKRCRPRSRDVATVAESADADPL